MTECKYVCDRIVPVSCATYYGSGPLDPERFHILLVESGSIWLDIHDIRHITNSGSIICLSKPFRYEVLYASNLKAAHLSFAPEYIHFDLNWNKMMSPDYKVECGKFHYPTFDIFLNHSELFTGIMTPDNDSLSHITASYDSIKSQFEEQPDERWACRSKLFLLRIFRILDTIRSEITITPKKDPLFLKAEAYIANHMHEKLTIDIVRNHLFIDRGKLNKLIQVNSGMTLSEYVDKQRLDMACKNLDIGDLTLTEIAKMVGFDDYTNFGKYFKKHMGVTPARYREMTKFDRNKARNQKA